MNRPIRVLSVVCLALFLALMLNATYIQFLQADSLNQRDGNTRVIQEEFSRERGPIVVDGEAIAESVPVDGQYRFQRVYHDPELYGKITGFFSLFERSGLESSQNPILSGSDNRLFVNRVVDLFANNQPKGGSIELTIDPRVQEVAYSSLEATIERIDRNRSAADREAGITQGAVVAIEPSTGAILAMVDYPSLSADDMIGLSNHSGSIARETKAELDASDHPLRPLLNRATQHTTPPGSTFKLVTAAAAIENLGLNARSMVNGGARLEFPDTTATLPNASGGSCGGDEITLQRAMEVSCNVAFGDLAIQVGQDALREQAEALGFGSSSELQEIPGFSSRFAPGDSLSPSQLAFTGIGQFEVAATPLQMAMVTAAIANEGDLMRPYLVQTVRAPNLSVLEEHSPERISRAMRASTAETLTELMVSTVVNGTAGSARISNVDVAGKTGTAETGDGNSNLAWFVAFAPADNPQVAVAVMIHPGPGAGNISGGGIAGPIAQAVMEAVLGQ